MNNSFSRFWNNLSYDLKITHYIFWLIFSIPIFIWLSSMDGPIIFELLFSIFLPFFYYYFFIIPIYIFFKDLKLLNKLKSITYKFGNLFQSLISWYKSILPSNNVAYKIRELNSLKNEGIISQKEFEDQKSKLLSKF